jgi:hypothetical protein
MIKRFAPARWARYMGPCRVAFWTANLAQTAAIDKEKSNGLDEDLEPGLERQ